MAYPARFKTAIGALWVIGLLVGLGLFFRALQYLLSVGAEVQLLSVLYVAPVALAVVWLAFAIRWQQEFQHVVPLNVVLFSTMPFVPVAALGFFLQPPFQVGASEIGDIIHSVRGGRVVLGTVGLSTVYLHALVGGVCFRYIGRKASFRSALVNTATSLAPFVVVGALLVVGLTQALTYISIAFDDQVRYWSVADALARGEGYPFRFFDQAFADSGSGLPFWTDDLPVWPLAMLAGFALFGHTTAGSYAPLIAANVLLPLVAYLAVRNICKEAALAFGIAVTLVLFPMYQIYALGAAEPEPIFHLLLLGMIASVPQNNSWRRWMLFGTIAGLVVLTRPEGGIYAAVTFAVLVIARWREIGVWGAGAVAAMPTALYAGVTWMQTGRPWPLQRATYFAVENLLEHWQGFSTVGAAYYSVQLRTTTIGFWLVVVLLLASFLWGTVWLALNRPAFLFVPLAAGSHALLLWLTEAGPALTNVENPSDFFRHMSHAVPFTWVTASLGIFALVWSTRYLWRRWLLILIFALATYYSYQVLITPEATYGSAGILLPSSQGHSLLRSDTYVLAQDLFVNPYPLPEIQHTWRDGFLSMDPWDYLGFRTSAFEFYSSFDMHNVDVGKPYMMASFYASLFAYVTLALAALGIPMARKEAKKRSWWRTASLSRPANS